MCKAEIPASPLNVGSLLALGDEPPGRAKGGRDGVGCNLEKPNSYIHGAPANWTYGVCITEKLIKKKN